MGGVLLFSTVNFELTAQTAEAEAEKGGAPRYLLDMKLGDADADVLWEGYWKHNFSYGTGWENGSDGFVFPSAFPGFQEGFEFSQKPDFFLSVLLLNHYFLETSITEDSDKNTYVMGYMGGDDSPVKELRIGNAGIGIGEYEGIDVSSPDYNTPGISGRFQTELSEHEFMIRYDPTEEQEKTFLGEYEVTEEEIPLNNFSEGRYFILPNENISTLKLYLEDDSGELTGSDGRNYTSRNLEYALDLSDGFLTLDDESDGRVLVYYEKSGSSVGDTTIAEDFIMETDTNFRPDPSRSLLPFSWTDINPYYDYTTLVPTFADTSLVTIEGRDALLLYAPGEFSCFQLYNHYPYSSSIPSESWRTDISLVDSGSGTDQNTETLFNYVSDREDDVISVQITGSEERAPENRIPFYKENPEIYGPAPGTDSSKISRKLVISVKESSVGYYLGSGLIKGSVQVYVNGKEDQSISVDYKTGELNFTRYIFPDDRITVYYRTESTGFSGGDLFMAQGNRMILSQNSRLELAEALRWTIPEDKLTQEAGESPGIVDLAANYYYEKENLDVKVSTGMTLRSSDTAGNLRILGMEDSGYSFTVSKDQLVPAEEDLTPASTVAPDGYDASNRVALTYRDFYSNNTNGQSYLNSYEWTGASEDSSREGPSVASAASDDDDFSSRVMVMTYHISGNEWSAGDYLPVEEEAIDLSGYSELSFYLKRQNLGDDDLKLSLLLGENGESTDYNESGSIDRGDSNYLLIESGIPLPPSEDVWQKVSISLSSRDQMKLTKVRSYRFVLENENDLNSSGELLAAGFRGEGSPLLLKVLDADGVEQDSDNIQAVELRDSSLTSDFPEVSSIFHPDDDSQKVLKVSWGSDSGGSGLSSDEYWRGISYMDGLSATDYGEFSLYIKHKQTGGTGYISLCDPHGKGVKLEYEPGNSDEWEKLTVNLREGTADFSGASSVSKLTINKGSSEFTRFSAGMSGLSSGTIYLDEVHLSDPLLSTRSMAEYTVDYKIPGDIYLISGGFPLLRNFEVYNRFNYTTKNSQSYFSDRENQIETQLKSGVDFMMARLEGDFDLSYSKDNPEYAVGHLIRIPAESSFGWISDSYSRSFQQGDDVMSRENLLHLTPVNPLTLELKTAGTGSGGEMTQQWSSIIGWRWPEPADLKINLDFYQSSHWVSDSENYFGDWEKDFKYISPLDEGIQSRQGQNSNTLYIQTEEMLGFSLKTSLEYSAEESYEWTQQNLWSSELSFPLTLDGKRGDWTLEPGYSRTLKNTLYPKNNDSFQDDLESCFKGINAQFPLWNFIPFYEIFARDTMSPFKDTLTLTDESSYSPEVFVEMSRMPGSALSDLIVPSSLDFSMDREYSSDVDTLYWENNWDFQVVQSALNLFGEYGTHPYFDFYETDEWTTALQYTLTSRDHWTPEPEKLVFQNYFTLRKDINWEILLDNSFTVQFEDETKDEDFQLIFRWAEEEKEWVRFPLIDYLIMKPNHLHHEEKLLFSGSFDNLNPDNNSWETTLTHESTLLIDELGSIKGWMALGLSGYDEVFQNGFELGLELKLTF
ncbi:MAG: hypothetical protein B6241_06045 [Spirochaetaceae bacterium 4572_59]|nr:MAG: hypothetical protein B6241_06045 [Spirochaetaceae bacterium 4572_59]